MQKKQMIEIEQEKTRNSKDKMEDFVRRGVSNHMIYMDGSCSKTYHLQADLAKNRLVEVESRYVMPSSWDKKLVVFTRT